MVAYPCNPQHCEVKASLATQRPVWALSKALSQKAKNKVELYFLPLAVLEQDMYLIDSPDLDLPTRLHYKQIKGA